MGLEVVIENGEGEQLASVEDPTNILHRVLPAEIDRTFCCLSYVDWYGDTIFNALQVPMVRDELAARCLSQPGLYLKFYGD